MEKSSALFNPDFSSDRANLKVMAMKNFFYGLLFPLSICWMTCNGQAEFGGQHLKLERTIELSGVSGRIDHLTLNAAKNMLYIAAYGNNSIEVIDLSSGKLKSSIKGLQHPQGISYIPGSHVIVVSNADHGLLTFYDEQTFKSKRKFDLGDDADNIRYLPERKTVFVGYGSGAIAIIDETSQKIRGKIQLEGHPESFQVDPTSGKIWVNVPDANLIEVLDGNHMKVLAKWKQQKYSSNFPMAYDHVGKQLFVVFRHPSRLVVLDSETGEEIAVLKCTGDADDIFYDSRSKRILVTGGAGYIDIFQEKDRSYKLITHLASAAGARTSLWDPNHNELFVAVPKRLGHPAELSVYKMIEPNTNH